MSGPILKTRNDKPSETPAREQISATPPGKMGDRIPELDGLRGIALLLVIACHFSLGTTPRNGIEEVALRFLNAGWIGVDLFFVLSGFLITGILRKDKGKPGALKNFYVRRTLRIFPPYYAFLFGFFVVLPAIRPFRSAENIAAAADQIYLWTYTSNLTWLADYYPHLDLMGHFWSLAVEEHFYLLWPLCILRLNRRNAIVASVGTIVGATGLRCYFASQALAPDVLYSFTLCRVDSLAMGALIALLRESRGSLTHWTPAAQWVASVASMVLLSLCGIYGFWWSMPLVQLAGYSVLSIAFAACIILTLNRRPGFLRSRWLMSVGQYSYTMYIVHQPLRGVFAKLFLFDFPVPLLSTLILISGASLGSYAIAYASWHLFEAHLLKLKSRFA